MAAPQNPRLDFVAGHLCRAAERGRRCDNAVGTFTSSLSDLGEIGCEIR